MMSMMNVRDILKVTGGDKIVGDDDFICENFSKDTRTISDGDVYIGIKGENFDGNEFWRNALDNGADAVIVQGIDFENEDVSKYKDKTIISVDDTLEALYKIANYKRNLYNITVIAITGSVGKTSTKDVVSNVVKQKYVTLKTEGNNNNNIGLPFTILRLKNEEAMVLEMGMNHLGEISLLSKIARPDICIITNVGTSHIGNLGSRENILKAKLEILDGSSNPTVIINNDNDLLHKWYEENKGKYNIKTYGINNKSDLMAEDISLGDDDSVFETKIKSKKIKVKVPVGGEHFVLNSLCAICVGEVLDIEEDKIVEGIESFELTKKRMDIINLKDDVKIINDSYNASLESMEASLKYLKHLPNKRKIAVLGDMFELGDFAKELHKKVGEEVVKDNIDILICSGKNAKYIVEEAECLGMNKENIYYFEDKSQIVEKLKEILEKGDAILVKASNGMQFFKLVDKLIETF